MLLEIIACNAIETQDYQFESINCVTEVLCVREEEEEEEEEEQQQQQKENKKNK